VTRGIGPVVRGVVGRNASSPAFVVGGDDLDVTELTCDAAAMLAFELPACSARPRPVDADPDYLAGWQYEEPEFGLRLMCVRSGVGAVRYRSRPLRAVRRRVSV
jgi:hypothetical protein